MTVIICITVMFMHMIVFLPTSIACNLKGFSMAMAGLDGGRINIGSCSLGAAQASYELAVAYIKERKQFNTPIADYQATQFKIVKMASNINTMRLSLRSAGDGNVNTYVPRGLDISF